MSSHPPPTDHFEMSVNNLLVPPEIQEVFKRDTSNNDFVPVSASDAGIHDTVAESKPDDFEEKLQVQKQDPSERHHLQLLPSTLVLPTVADKIEELEPKTPGISPIDLGNRTAKVVHEICATEREGLRHKTKVLTASLQRIKRADMDINHQQRQLQESRSELCRLLQIEAQLKEYETRSVESLEVEFQMLQQEVAKLSYCVEVALQEEIDWIDRMKNFQRKQRPQSDE